MIPGPNFALTLKSNGILLFTIWPLTIMLTEIKKDSAEISGTYDFLQSWVCGIYIQISIANAFTLMLTFKSVLLRPN